MTAKTAKGLTMWWLYNCEKMFTRLGFRQVFSQDRLHLGKKIA